MSTKGDEVALLIKQLVGRVCPAKYAEKVDIDEEVAKREQADLQTKRTLTPQQFRQRCSQILNSYTEPKEGQQFSRLQKLVRGMPKRLQKCKANKYGRCGK